MAKARELGVYWVRFPDEEWTIAEYVGENLRTHENEWYVLGGEERCQDSDFGEIGDRIIRKEE